MLGISWQEVTITGQSNHAGTTPMSMRRDAGFAAARLAVAVREIAAQASGQPVGTVGSIQLYPDLVNVVAARATITVDLRNTDAAALRAMRDAFDAAVAAVARDEQVDITSRVTADFDPVVFDDDLVAIVEDVSTALGHTVRRLPSGAGHDAQMLARMCPKIGRAHV